MEAHGEDSDGLDYESPVELERATRAVASSGSPSRQILRDAPKAVPDRAPRGKHDRRAARRRPIQAPESAHQAARRLRVLVPTLLRTVVDFGRHVKHAMATWPSLPTSGLPIQKNGTKRLPEDFED